MSTRDRSLDIRTTNRNVCQRNLGHLDQPEPQLEVTSHYMWLEVSKGKKYTLEKYTPACTGKGFEMAILGV